MKFFLKGLIIIIFLINNIAKAEINNLPNCEDNSIWKHAAYKNNFDINFKNVKSSIDDGYCGIELDIIYDENENIIYVSHNKIDSNERKKSLSLNFLGEIVRNENVYIWLDWKNTKISNLAKGLEIIEDSMKEYLSKENSLIFIETPYIAHNEILELLNKNTQIAVLNWMSYSSEKNNLTEKIKNLFRISRAWLYVCFFQDKWVSSHDIKILKLCENKRKAKSIFIFTINDQEKADEAFLMGANVVLSDTLK